MEAEPVVAEQATDAPTPPPSDDESRGRLRHLAVIVAALAAVGLIGLLAYGVIAQSPDTTIDDGLSRNQAVAAPAFRLAVLRRGELGSRLDRSLAPVLADDQVSSRELRGTAYVLNFWASWCVPCREEAPLLQRTWRRVSARGVLFLGLDMQDVPSDARAFMDEFGVDYLNIRDPTNRVLREYGATGIPETFFVSAAGEVVNHVIGVITSAQLRRGIAAALAGHPRAALQGGARRPAR